MRLVVRQCMPTLILHMICTILFFHRISIIWYDFYHNIEFLWHFDKENGMCFKTGIQYQRNSVNIGVITLILFKPIETHAFVLMTEAEKWIILTVWVALKVNFNGRTDIEIDLPFGMTVWISNRHRGIVPLNRLDSDTFFGFDIFHWGSFWQE